MITFNLHIEEQQPRGLGYGYPRHEGVSVF